MKETLGFPVPTRILEYVGFFSIKVATGEGPAWLFVAYDPFEDYIFSIGVENNDDDETILGKIYFLMEEPEFAKNAANGFILVLGEYSHLTSSIQKIIGPMKGRTLFDTAFNEYLLKPVIEGLNRYMQRRR